MKQEVFLSVLLEKLYQESDSKMMPDKIQNASISVPAIELARKKFFLRTTSR